jgi:glycosyltransferase involved in cell wall biosynthesis
MSRISVIILTLNEEKNIGDCLDSVRWADEVLVVDSGSADMTVKIAEQHGARTLVLPWEGYGPTKNRALEQTTGDWVLWLDADERVSDELGREIRMIITRNETPHAGFEVARRAYFLGRWIKHCGWYPSFVTRLFRKGQGRFSNQKVHEQLVLHGTKGRLSNDIMHLTDPDLGHYFNKFNRYTSLAAEEMHSAGRRFRLTDLIVRPAFTFLRMYILRLGVLDGMQGLILCAVSSAYVFSKYAKLWELEKKTM